ncbi:MAG: DUF2332 family protein [Rhodanobacter sp.]
MSTIQPVLDAFAQQATYCREHGSPFTARLLRCAADGLARGEPVLRAIAAWPGDPVADALPLRLAGALHALVLEGRADALARHYPGAAGASDDAALWQAVAVALQTHPDVLSGYLASPPQTNEVGRSAVLLGGFMAVAARTGLPLRLLELGASAGLNLNWDRYRYRLGDVHWGDTGSPLELAPLWHGAAPPLAGLRVASRMGCDLAPVDVAEDAQRLRLRSYVWADQRARMEQLDAALSVAKRHHPRVERAGADDWLERRLAEPAAGAATVVYHSIFWNYLPAAAKARIGAAIAHAAQSADATAPLAWLRFEFDDPSCLPSLRLSLWPGALELHLADAQAHGQEVFWHADDEADAALRAPRHGRIGASPTM